MQDAYKGSTRGAAKRTGVSSGRGRRAEPCLVCEVGCTTGTCRWCREVGAPSPIAEEHRRGTSRAGLRQLAENSGVSDTILRRAAVGEGTLTVDAAVKVARAIGCRVEELSIDYAAAKTRARRAALRARGAA